MVKQEVHRVRLTQEDVRVFLAQKNISINDFAKTLSTDNHEGKIIIADCSGVPLQEFNFKGADLRGAIFKGANLEDANLEGADLRGADLSNASCTKINLTKAKCAGLKTNDGTDLGGAETKGATGKLKHTDIQEETFTRTLKDKVEWDAKVNEWNEDRPRYKKFLDGLSGVFFEQTLTRKVKRRGGALIGAILFGGVAYSLAGALLFGSTIATAGTLPLIIAGITVVSAAAGALIGASKGLTFMTALVAVVMPLKLVSGIATASVGLISVLSGQTIQKITTKSLKDYLGGQQVVSRNGDTERVYRQRLKIARASAYRAKARGEILKAQVPEVDAVQSPASVQSPDLPQDAGGQQKEAKGEVKRTRAQSFIIVRPKPNRNGKKKRRHSTIDKLNGAPAVSVSRDSAQPLASSLPDNDGIQVGSKPESPAQESSAEQHPNLRRRRGSSVIDKTPCNPNDGRGWQSRTERQNAPSSNKNEIKQN